MEGIKNQCSNSLEESLEGKIKKPCKHEHELDPLTEYFRKGRIHGKCKKCGCFLIRTRAVETFPKRERPKMNKKERRRVNKLVREVKE